MPENPLQDSPRNVPPTPSGSLFDQATAFARLWEAWERVRSNNGAAGGDGLTVTRFGEDAATRVSRLSHALRTGKYRPGPSRRAFIPKPRGGTRPLDIPCVTDRIAQGAVAITLMPILEKEFEDSSFGYRRGRSVAQAVARIAAYRRDGYDWVVDGDIEHYFERIPHDRLIQRLEQQIDDSRLVDIIALWLETHTHDGRGLPQGSPLSPLLANLYLDEIDERIASRGVRLVRFADDFVLLCKSPGIADGALTQIRDLLGEHGLELHPEKTRVVSFDKGFRFLGHVFVRSMVWREVLREELPSDDLVAAAEHMLRTAVENNDPPEANQKTTTNQGRWASRRRVLYVLEKHRRLDTHGNAFVVTEDQAELLTVPHTKVDRIDIGPDVDCSTAALDLAATTDTEIFRVDRRGEIVGRWSGPDSNRAARHLAQAATILDTARRCLMARTFVKGRVFNQRALLRRLN